jgi:hypothetical protein
MLNNPTVLKNGDWLVAGASSRSEEFGLPAGKLRLEAPVTGWLLPVGLWRDNTNVPNVKFDAEELAQPEVDRSGRRKCRSAPKSPGNSQNKHAWHTPYTIEMLTHNLGDERGSNVYRPTDQGESFERIGQVRISGTRVDEHMIVERGDGSLSMLLRNTGGIAQSVSTDGSRTWSDGSLYLQDRMFRNKRFFVRRQKSGALLMVRNNSPDGKRSHMTAFVSDDDGVTWKGGLLLDERESSYPDGIQAEDGTLFIIYDHQRYTLNRVGKRGVGSVQIAVFSEEDVRAGKPMSDEVRLKIDVTRLRKEP